MNYLSTRARFVQQGIVSVFELRKAFPDFDKRRMVEWQQRGYLRRIINGWYCFTEIPVTEPLLWWAANRIYQPAYLSLETALSYHGIIPEGVYTFTSVSPRNTRTFETSLGSFRYQHLKPSLYFGYDILRPAGQPVLMANLEKALLDYCYLHPQLTTVADFAALRLNSEVLRQRLNQVRLTEYLQLFQHQRLTQRVRALLQSASLNA